MISWILGFWTLQGWSNVSIMSDECKSTWVTVSHKNPAHLTCLWAFWMKYPRFFLKNWPFYCPKRPCKFMSFALLNVVLDSYFLKKWKSSNVSPTLGMKKIPDSLPEL